MNRLKEILVVVAGVITAMLIMVFAPVAALAQDTVGEDVPPSTPILGDIFTSNSEILFTLLAAAAIPWVVALINQQVWSSLVKQVVAFVTCAVAATGYLVYKDQTVLAFDGLPRLFVLVAAIAYGFYRMYFKPVNQLQSDTTVLKNGDDN
jgi:hypothetical protein